MTHAWFEPAKKASDADWELRCDFARAFRILARFGLADPFFTRITAATGARPGKLLTKPEDILPEEVTAASLKWVEVNQLGPNDAFGANKTVHISQPDAACVILLSTVAGAAAARWKSLPKIDGAAKPLLSQIEWARDLESLPAGNAFLVPGFGTLAVGKNIREAFFIAYFLERLCAVEVAAGGAGDDESWLPLSLGLGAPERYAGLWSSLARTTSV